MVGLAHSAVNNFSPSTTGAASDIGLSGPVVRGDTATVESHLALLDGSPGLADIAALYRACARLALPYAPVSVRAELARLIEAEALP